MPGLMSSGGSKVFSFKEAIMKIYKTGVVQAGIAMTKNSVTVGTSPSGEYIRTVDTNFYAIKSATFFIVTANRSFRLKTQIKHVSAGALIYTIQADRYGDGVLILAL